MSQDIVHHVYGDEKSAQLSTVGNAKEEKENGSVEVSLMMSFIRARQHHRTKTMLTIKALCFCYAASRHVPGKKLKTRAMLQRGRLLEDKRVHNLINCFQCVFFPGSQTWWCQMLRGLRTDYKQHNAFGLQLFNLKRHHIPRRNRLSMHLGTFPNLQDEVLRV